MDTLTAPPAPSDPGLCFLYRRGLVSYYLSDDPQGPSGARRLPDIPSSIINYLVITCDRFWHKHQRCMGVLLLFTPATGHWGWHLPHQRCGAHFSDGCLERVSDHIMPPGTHLAGSLQSVSRDPASELYRLPRFPGLHFVCMAPEFGPTLSVLLACDLEQRHCRKLSVPAVTIDDQRHMIESASTRLNLLDE